jgi:hypothetical protein
MMKDNAVHNETKTYTGGHVMFPKKTIVFVSREYYRARAKKKISTTSNTNTCFVSRENYRFVSRENYRAREQKNRDDLEHERTHHITRE